MLLQVKGKRDRRLLTVLERTALNSFVYDPQMTWDDALNFCQSAGLRGLSLGSSKSEEDIEELMSKALDPYLKMETFWVAGYVLHPMADG